LLDTISARELTWQKALRSVESQERQEALEQARKEQREAARRNRS
jgi:hypothetical protein